MQKRDVGKNYNNPMNIYELHAGSWKQKEDGSWYDYEELAEELGLTREEVVEALNVSAPPLSLTVSSEEGETQIDLPVQSPEENLSERMALRQSLGELEPRDRQLIILRYFMDKTQTQTAQQLGMTQVQVSRREKKLLLAMRQKLL